MIEAALKQGEKWQAEGAGLPISVNVSAHFLQHPSFVQRLEAALGRHPALPVGWLELEVLESSALSDVSRASSVIEACTGLGVRVALDDFGTGYSSLAYLKRLPADVLKIDQGFVRDMLHDPDDLSILEGVLGLARAFRREVIAEGVETLSMACCCSIWAVSWRRATALRGRCRVVRLRSGGRAGGQMPRGPMHVRWISTAWPYCVRELSSAHGWHDCRIGSSRGREVCLKAICGNAAVVHGSGKGLPGVARLWRKFPVSIAACMTLPAPWWRMCWPVSWSGPGAASSTCRRLRSNSQRRWLHVCGA